MSGLAEVSGRPVGFSERLEISSGFGAPLFNAGSVGVPSPNAGGIGAVLVKSLFGEDVVKSLCGIGVV